MKRIVCIIGMCVVGLSLAGCSSGGGTRNVDITNDPGQAVMELDYRDFDQAATAMVQSLLQSGVLKKKDGGRYVMATGRITNDTMQRIDTDQLMAKVEEELMNSGMVVMTSAVGGKGASDEMLYQVRDLKKSDVADEFDPNSMAAKRQLIAPELSIAGKILQRNIRYDRGTQQVEYYFQLQLTEIASGLRYWQKETIIGKRGSRRTVPW
ncbi:MAG: penicillin-binding protein activator LpoB [Sedimentisphaerales bacterium]|nr:penicillin-binding protein activator LpoB [Sedimentisphaerales bacterium]